MKQKSDQNTINRTFLPVLFSPDHDRVHSLDGLRTVSIAIVLAAHFTQISDYGFTGYAQVIMVNDQLLTTHPDAIRAFLTATFAGWDQALADIPATAKIVAGQYAADGSKYTDVDYQATSLKLNVGSEGIGVIDPATWTEASELMANYGIIDVLPAPETSLATGFWPTA